MSNYPENIRQFDDDPRSPFYVEPPLTDCCEAEMDGEFCSGCGEYYGDHVDMPG